MCCLSGPVSEAACNAASFSRRSRLTVSTALRILSSNIPRELAGSMQSDSGRDLCFRYQLRERPVIGRRNLGEHLSVQVSSGHLQTVDEPALTVPMGAAARADANAPCPAKVAVGPLAADIAVAQGDRVGFLGRRVELSLGKEIALGELENFLPASVTMCTA